MEQVKIKPSVLREQVETGMKLDELASHYGLPKAQMKKALGQLGLKIRRFHGPKFVFEEELQGENVEIPENGIEEEIENNYAENNFY